MGDIVAMRDRCLGLSAAKACPTVLVVMALAFGTPSAMADQSAGAPTQCRPEGTVVKVPELPEASGIAVSRRVPGRLWAHNDSGEPVLVALDTKGAVTGRLRLSGAKVEDWEAIAVGPCPAGSCIYVGDIGDNDAGRKQITLYRLPEPAVGTESAQVSDVFHATYPDGPHDGEALMVTRDGRVHVITKGETGPVAVYRFPGELRSGATVQLERIGRPRESGKSGEEERITDAAISPDGEWAVLRTNQSLTFFRTAELLAGNWRQPGRVDLAHLGEPQGEGVAFGDDNTIYVVGEGGGKSQPGTFARLSCTRDR